ncbi:CPBP family intramembrane metalloprotease [Microbacterium sp. EYE_5]|uniref:CPBP family intramembrane glutamic endopeptidase n=1 Tax=unclassified Microbacterium TaxID=2609290 RepID=UPI0020053F22|nr:MULTISPECIES: CPBP family intramembrane glutamic endopeptidase [unclassified Microbacterium]MCK6081430.1 CPBP family intramembrane metalloprotease [Microbacterium sp. EYE_382]MCK6086700.1 CPBP family intramembrane metalloprotease [Microbacterium sp. EYE_384]MCK6123802.1 CPBP family intramembrane metalloprotease [Microbacterium sp. EYE_80]MCK6126711.1 CPBP family intramembrane metalloprotease [Microbacterium sp. EYE_79]MCK6142385.1 CPBP family intramembrane metalloprotease [Microbacterium sp
MVRGDAAVRPVVDVRVVPALLVCLAAPAFFVALIPWLGWLLLAAGLAVAVLIERRDAAASTPSLTRDLSLIAVGLLIVSVIPLKAELDNAAMLRFTLALGGAVLVPYLVSRFVYRDHAIRFPWRGGGRWTGWQWAWLVGVLVLGWLLLPFYFITSGVYENWPVVDTSDLIARLFVGVGAVGIWDELFFICTCFALLRRHFADATANVLQAIVFVSFLWELGYRAWGPALTIPFALLQAVIFLRTKSLAYVVTVHLLFDAVVFGVLVHAHNPGLLDAIFLVPSP